MCALSRAKVTNCISKRNDRDMRRCALKTGRCAKPLPERIDLT
jgi:hypothetical protein